MIDLQIEKYCNNCCDFEVEQETVTLNNIGVCETVHRLSCKHKEKCKALKRHLEELL